MISPAVLNKPFQLEKQKTPDAKLMRVLHHTFKTIGCNLAQFGHGAFFSLDHNWWDGLPLDGLVLLRVVYVIPSHRGNGCQVAMLNTVSSMAYMTGYAVLAVAHTFEMKKPVESKDDFVDQYCSDYGDPLDFFGPKSAANRRLNSQFKRFGWHNIDIHENIGTPWITPDCCWVHIPDTASPDLIQKLTPRPVNPASSLA